MGKLVTVLQLISMQKGCLINQNLVFLNVNNSPARFTLHSKLSDTVLEFAHMAMVNTFTMFNFLLKTLLISAFILELIVS